jgi:thiol-disulfide isomerase/thioredoxin
MKPFFRFLALSLATASLPIAASAEVPPSPIAGYWQGTATICSGATLPVTLHISGASPNLKFALLNGPVSQPEESSASSVTFDGTHLTATFDYYARKIVATLDGNTLTGTYLKGGLCDDKREDAPFTATRVPKPLNPTASPKPPSIAGDWEIATKSEKHENAWALHVDPPTAKAPLIRAAIQRIDGDTGALWGTWNGAGYVVGHFSAANTILFSLTPKPDGTLIARNLLAGPTAPDLIARRPADARKQSLAPPTDPTQQTKMKDPTAPFAFNFPDLSGKLVSNTDPQFQGKVVLVTIGGSWCPNCHDEAPFLVSLYNKFHGKGLEIVEFDFEQGTPDTDIPRLRAFLARYGIPYTVLLAGQTDELEKKIPQADNLDCWPTSFFLGRDGLVHEIHAGFAGPGNPAGHAELIRSDTALIEKLLAEPAPR